MKDTLTTIGLAIIAGALLIVGLKAVSTLETIKAQELKNQAVQGCMETSSYTYNDGKGVTTVEPIKTAYTTCLELKGY